MDFTVLVLFFLAIKGILLCTLLVSFFQPPLEVCIGLEKTSLYCIDGTDLLQCITDKKLGKLANLFQRLLHMMHMQAKAADGFFNNLDSDPKKERQLFIRCK